MKSKSLLFLGALVLLAGSTGARAATIVNGQFTDPAGLIYGTYIQGAEDGGVSNPTNYSYVLDGGPAANGNARDWLWLQDTGGSVADAQTGLWYDLGGQANKLVVFPIVDHGPVLEESFEYDVFMSDDKVNWTEATLETLYDQGWDANPSITDGYTTVWTLGLNQTFRYASVAWGNPGNPDPSYRYADGDCEIDAVAGLQADGSSVDPVPEPASFALLGLGLLPFAWRMRKRHAK